MSHLPSDAILKLERRNSTSGRDWPLIKENHLVYAIMARLLTMLSINNLSALLKSVLEQEIAVETGLLPAEHCKGLLNPEESISPLTSETGKYPKFPLYIELCKTLLQWMENGDFPVKSKDCGLLTERDFIAQREEMTKKTTPLLEALRSSWSETSDFEKAHQLTLVLKLLGIRGILDLLNICHTQGSVDVLPPSVSSLLASFNKKHKPNSNLTVGARALSKHCHRDVTSEWWGACAGSEQVKNEHANRVVNGILNDSSWINIHLLPHDLKVIEVRCSEGYGARWSHDGSTFRGFLEPQMEDGHAVGWKH